jgi:probable phosphoglycerate mutase
MTSHQLVIEADGGSRGNPGPAGSGAIIIDAATGEILREIAIYIGEATNNVAEYRALKAAITEVLNINPQASVLVRMDSKLVIEQMSGNWKIKHPDMRQLAIEVQQLAAGLNVAYQWIPREQNSRADALANRAMDEQGESISATGSHLHPSIAEFNTERPSSVRAPGRVTAELTTVFLVRHGRTHLTESKRLSGRGGENPPLSEQGRDDAARVAKALSQVGSSGHYSYLREVTAVVSSPIARTMETAKIIAEELGVPVEVDDDLAEISFGDWDAHTHEEILAKWPQEWENWRGSWTVSPPNGESLADFDSRVLAAKQRIVDKYAGKSVAVVSHVMPIRGFVRAAYEAGISAYWSTQVAPCSLTVLRLWSDQAVEVVSVNDTTHL